MLTPSIHCEQAGFNWDTFTAWNGKGNPRLSPAILDPNGTPTHAMTDPFDWLPSNSYYASNGWDASLTGINGVQNEVNSSPPLQLSLRMKATKNLKRPRISSLSSFSDDEEGEPDENEESEETLFADDQTSSMSASSSNVYTPTEETFSTVLSPFQSQNFTLESSLSIKPLDLNTGTTHVLPAGWNHNLVIPSSLSKPDSSLHISVSNSQGTESMGLNNSSHAAKRGRTTKSSWSGLTSSSVMEAGDSTNSMNETPPNSAKTRKNKSGKRLSPKQSKNKKQAKEKQEKGEQQLKQKQAAEEESIDHPLSANDSRLQYLEKNRLAAFKSRQKKRDRVSNLETLALEVATRNISLQQEALELKSEVEELKRLVYAHVLCHHEKTTAFIARDRQGEGLPALLEIAGQTLTRDYSKLPYMGSRDDVYALEEENEDEREEVASQRQGGGEQISPIFSSSAWSPSSESHDLAEDEAQIKKEVDETKVGPQQILFPLVPPFQLPKTHGGQRETRSSLSPLETLAALQQQQIQQLQQSYHLLNPLQSKLPFIQHQNPQRSNMAKGDFVPAGLIMASIPLRSAANDAVVAV